MGGEAVVLMNEGEESAVGGALERAVTELKVAHSFMKARMKQKIWEMEVAKAPQHDTPCLVTAGAQLAAELYGRYVDCVRLVSFTEKVHYPNKENSVQTSAGAIWFYTPNNAEHPRNKQRVFVYCASKLESRDCLSGTFEVGFCTTDSSAPLPPAPPTVALSAAHCDRHREPKMTFNVSCVLLRRLFIVGMLLSFIESKLLAGVTFPVSPDYAANIVVMDGATGAQTILATLPGVIPLGGTVDRNTQEYKLVSSGSGKMRITSYNLTSGEVTRVTSIAVSDLEGLVFDSFSDSLYATYMNPVYGGACICKVNEDAGTCDCEASVPQVVGYFVSAVAWNQVDREYIHIYDMKNGTSYTDSYVFVSLNKDEIEHEVPSATDETCLAYDNTNGRLLAATGSQIAYIDMTTGEPIDLCPTQGGITEEGGLVLSDDSTEAFISAQYMSDYFFTVVNMKDCSTTLTSHITAPIYYLSLM
ncbi:hypothetical protein Pelo_12999 [Pelomyxa schiedti]|nr:hypothetical protein Pelo_12999 [Pelomyxa schiedti]